MNFRISHLILAAVVAATSVGQAQAAAFVDSDVRAAVGNVKVIVMLRDRVAPVRSARSVSSYVRVRKALMANAKLSQQRLLSDISSKHGFAAGTKAKPFWIINAVSMTIPASEVASLENHPDVKAIYANREVRLINDFRASTRDLKAEPFTYGLSIMNIPQLRQEKAKSTGEGVVVGILDTGVFANHPDLKGKVIGFRDFVNGKTEAYDDHGHGTHVAGTIAGGDTSGTSIGVAPGSKIIMAKVFGASGSSDTETLINGMQWIADPDGNPATHDSPSLVSNSWGGGRPSPSADPAADVFCQAVGSWMKLGIFPVFAAGNAGPGKGTVGTPGACPESYAVGATDQNDAIAPFSSKGPTVWKTGTLNKPNISAPGVAILSAAPNGKYQSMSGTSMATPHVAGLLSLIYQVMPNITIADAAKIVSGSSKDLGDAGIDPVFGAGRIDALSAVKATQSFRARSAH